MLAGSASADDCGTWIKADGRGADDAADCGTWIKADDRARRAADVRRCRDSRAADFRAGPDDGAGSRGGCSDAPCQPDQSHDVVQRPQRV
jgi:hypothetical protein